MIQHENERQEEEFATPLHFSSDVEESKSDEEEVYSETEKESRRPLDYDLDKMFEIVQKRENNKWSLQTIKNHYKKISDNPGTARSQIWRFF